jgi:hypothetical protein
MWWIVEDFPIPDFKEDHLEIAAKYLTSENIEQLKSVVDISHFKPLLYILYSRNRNSDLSQFIDSLFKIYTQEWNQLARLNATLFLFSVQCNFLSSILTA